MKDNSNSSPWLLTREEALARRNPKRANPYWWQEYGMCNEADPDLFFPEKGKSSKPAKEICRRCIVREECLEFALARVYNDDYGIQGGMSKDERNMLRKALVAGQAVVIDPEDEAVVVIQENVEV